MEYTFSTVYVYGLQQKNPAAAAVTATATTAAAIITTVTTITGCSTNVMNTLLFLKRKERKKKKKRRRRKKESLLKSNGMQAAWTGVMPVYPSSFSTASVDSCSLITFDPLWPVLVCRPPQTPAWCTGDGKRRERGG